MFAPSATPGLLRPADLAGYRNAPVYIRRSIHVPPNSDAVRDAMPVFFEMLTQEAEPSVCVVLGYFIFVYIHPYMDGNGRIGRFLMNVISRGRRIPLDSSAVGTAGRLHGCSGRSKRAAEDRAIRRLSGAACS
jgi:hypothetical protein